MKTCIIYHSRDLDGWMSAAIVKHWFLLNNPNHHYIENKNKQFTDSIKCEYKGENTAPYPWLDLLGYDKVLPDLYVIMKQC